VLEGSERSVYSVQATVGVENHVDTGIIENGNTLVVVKSSAEVIDSDRVDS
jgi:hypothetical protein